jgi:phosphatidylserine/phosphatidylglycerophosphate/cardiolipin synthase-like enzyme
MDTARARLVTALRQLDRHDRLRIYHPYTTAGEPIYVHAKIMVVDGRALRIGSANMNNRSMGLDTECDLLVEAGDKDRAAAAIHAIECGLIAEHLAVSPDAVADALAGDGSLIAAIEAMRGEGHSLRPYEVKDVDAVEAWLADNAVLDPEGPSDLFEMTAATGLFRGWLPRPRA